MNLFKFSFRMSTEVFGVRPTYAHYQIPQKMQKKLRIDSDVEKMLGFGFPGLNLFFFKCGCTKSTVDCRVRAKHTYYQIHQVRQNKL